MVKPALDTLTPVSWDELRNGDTCYIDNVTHNAKPWVSGPFRVVDHSRKCLIAAAWYAEESSCVNRQRTFIPDQREMHRLRKIK